jgi:UDP-2-acetamido-3-amino-2,3-dideoxy-glucuronate N-acetyltransferase
LPNHAVGIPACRKFTNRKLRPEPRLSMLNPTTGVLIHPAGLCESTHVGSGTRVWAFAHVLPGATIGRDCNICDGVFIENDVIVGDRVTIKCGVQLWDGLRVEDDVFIGPNATFTNDRFPRIGTRPEQFPQTVIRRGASIGANATILPGLEIGRGAMVGAGAVVTRDVAPHTLVVGNPARFVRSLQQ